MVVFYSDELLALRPISSLEVHPLSAIRNYLLNIAADLFGASYTL
jgi:hypothetical protein